MDVDFIIVGQGLAGSAVAVQLLRRKKRIVVFDEAEFNNSSRIAAGLFNPITGKKLVKTWLADALFPYLHKYYTELEKETGQSFYYAMPLYRPFLSIEEQNEWASRAADPYYSGYVDQVFLGPTLTDVKDPYGGLLLRQSGFLSTRKYINAIAALIRELAVMETEKFFPEEIIISSNRVSYKQYSASGIIWCNGVHSSGYFDWVPIRPLKGETLTITADLPQTTIINRGVYLVPDTETNNWKVGSTYYFHDREPAITNAAREELEGKVKDILDASFEVVDHQWGFRPTTPDRRPVLGSHPEFDRMIIFNGLGTKGVSLAPFFSDVLVRWLEKEGAINKEVDIERFKSVYSGSSKKYGVS